MGTFIIFGGLSLLIILISWRTLFNIRSHGFYRFFSWECIAWLLAVNYRYWFVYPFIVTQIFSWILLFIAVYMALSGFITMRMKGKAGKGRDNDKLFGFEKTTELIDTGIFKYIRHPLYSSLIGLSWGIFLKNPTAILFIVSLLSTNFLYLTSKADEKECIEYFGKKYKDYMKRTKMFIPFII